MDQTENTHGASLTDIGTEKKKYDAILVVGFGGPEKKEDVLPFLENVTRGRNIPASVCSRWPSIIIIVGVPVRSTVKCAN